MTVPCWSSEWGRRVDELDAQGAPDSEMLEVMRVEFGLAPDLAHQVICSTRRFRHAPR